MPNIYLYAEVLTHLRQLTLHASLETEKNEETKIDISSDKKTITVTHDGESSSLYLPTQILGTAQVTFPYEKKTELSARVQIEDLEQWKETEAVGIEAPWNASELSFETALKCLECECELLSMGTISSWKDLPNSNWAEVMDLWFCHKPHEHHDSKDEKKAAETKGFSAQSKLASEPGLGLVDLISFALHPDDCNIAKIQYPNNKNSFKPISVSCPQCHSYVGMYSSGDNLVRLDKSSVSVQATRTSPLISFPPTAFISAQLLELIESTAVRKVVVYDQTIDSTPRTGEAGTTSIDAGSESNPQDRTQSKDQAEDNCQPLLLWIFNPDIYYSSSHLTTNIRSRQSPSINGTKTGLKASEAEKQTKSEPESSVSTNPAHTAASSEPNSGSAQSEDKAPSISTPTSSSPPSTVKTITPTITTHLPHRALKILYQPLSHSTLQSYLSSTPRLASQQYEPLPLPTSTLPHLRTALQTSTTLLPPSARTLALPSPNPPATSPTPTATTTTTTTPTTTPSTIPTTTWQVGLFDRYERHPTAERVLESNPLARKLAGEDLGMDGRPRVTRWEMPAGAAELYL